MRLLPVVALVGLLWLPSPAGAEDPVYFADSNLKARVEQTLWISDPTPTDMLGLTELRIPLSWERVNAIVDLTGLEYATNLTNLNLKYHKVSDLSPLSGLIHLHSVVLLGNGLSDISPLSTLIELESLDIELNEVSNISALSGLPNLASVGLHRNLISDISPLASLTSLQGFVVCDILARRHGVDFSGRRFNGRFASGRIHQEPVALLKPSTYMNRSGHCVAAAFGYYRLALEDLVVVHDDLDLQPGRVMVKKGGGTAGHKGLGSVVEQLGSPDFIRVRIGIGRPEDPRIDPSDYVLSPFPSADREGILQRLEVAADAVESIVREGLVDAMNAFNVQGESK